MPIPNENQRCEPTLKAESLCDFSDRIRIAISILLGRPYYVYSPTERDSRSESEKPFEGCPFSVSELKILIRHLNALRSSCGNPGDTLPPTNLEEWITFLPSRILKLVSKTGLSQPAKNLLSRHFLSCITPSFHVDELTVPDSLRAMIESRCETAAETSELSLLFGEIRLLIQLYSIGDPSPLPFPQNLKFSELQNAIFGGVSVSDAISLSQFHRYESQVITLALASRDRSHGARLATVLSRQSDTLGESESFDTDILVHDLKAYWEECEKGKLVFDPTSGRYRRLDAIAPIACPVPNSSEAVESTPVEPEAIGQGDAIALRFKSLGSTLESATRLGLGRLDALKAGVVESVRGFAKTFSEPFTRPASDDLAEVGSEPDEPGAGIPQEAESIPAEPEPEIDGSQEPTPVDGFFNKIDEEEMPFEGDSPFADYDKPLAELDPFQLQVNDVIYCETASGSVYEFKVTRKGSEVIELIEAHGRFDGHLLTLGRTMVRVGKTIQFPMIGHTSTLKRLEARKTALTPNGGPKPALIVKAPPLPQEKDELEALDSPVIAIGDSNGSFDGYWSNLSQTEVIDENGHWIAGDKIVVIHGDILADRQNEGFKILEHIHTLRIEAEKVGGDIVVLAGNHEDFMFSFLLGKDVANPNAERTDDLESVEGGDPLLMCIIGNRQGAGIVELTQFTGDGKPVDDMLSKDLLDRLSQALPAMREDPRGKRLLAEMCRMKLCEQIGDTLFIHTDPTNGILNLILDMGIGEINRHFQETLRRGLFYGDPFDPRYHFLFDTFLYTDNRTFESYVRGGKKHLNLDPDLIRRLSKAGISQVVFGHTNLGKGNRVHRVEGVTFVNVDQGAGKDKKKGISTVSGAALEVDKGGMGKITTGTRIVDIRKIQQDKANGNS